MWACNIEKEHANNKFLFSKYWYIFSFQGLRGVQEFFDFPRIHSLMDGPFANLLLLMTALTFFKSEKKKIGKLKINKIKITIIKLYRSWQKMLLLHSWGVLLPFKCFHFWSFKLIEVYIFWEGHKILWNLHLTFDYSTYSQKLGEDFAKFCGLLRIYELYTFYKN